MLLARQHSHITAEDIFSEATNVRGDDHGVCRFGLAVCGIVWGWFRGCFWAGLGLFWVGFRVVLGLFLCVDFGMAACPPWGRMRAAGAQQTAAIERAPDAKRRCKRMML